MKIKNFKFEIVNFTPPIAIIVFAVTLRLLPHPPNFAPIAAMALFGGCHLAKKYALVIPLLAMLISDLFLGFHSTMPFVYGSFLATGLFGIWLKNHKSVLNVFGVSLFSSILFFLVTNFGVWLSGGLYPKTLQGLLDAYVMAIPFFRNTIIGDLFYVGLFFGSYEIVKNIAFEGRKSKLEV